MKNTTIEYAPLSHKGKSLKMVKRTASNVNEFLTAMKEQKVWCEVLDSEKLLKPYCDVDIKEGEPLHDELLALGLPKEREEFKNGVVKLVLDKLNNVFNGKQIGH